MEREGATKERLKRTRAAVGIGLTWAAGWAPIGLLIGLVIGGNSRIPDGFPVDDWVMPLVALGFLGGAIFSTVLRIAAGRRRFDELSLPRFGAWGAVGGLLLGVVAVAAWQLDAGVGPVLWPRAAAMIGSATLLSAVSASGSLALARMAEARELLDASAEVAEVGLAGGEAQKRLRGRG